MESLQIPGGIAFQTEKTVSAKASRLNYAEFSRNKARVKKAKGGMEERKSKRWPCRALQRLWLSP